MAATQLVDFDALARARKLCNFRKTCCRGAHEHDAGAITAAGK